VEKIIWLQGPKLFSEVDTKGQWGGKQKGGYRAESEKESYVK
jgi:hypothetical protein